jgi:hypothetical protein
MNCRRLMSGGADTTYQTNMDTELTDSVGPSIVCRADGLQLNTDMTSNNTHSVVESRVDLRVVVDGDTTSTERLKRNSRVT